MRLHFVFNKSIKLQAQINILQTLEFDNQSLIHKIIC